MPILHIYGGSGLLGKSIINAFQAHNYEVQSFSSKDFNFNDSSTLNQFSSLVRKADTVVYASGINEPCSLDQITVESLQKHFSINLYAAVMVAKSYWNNFNQNGGRLVFISSILSQLYRKNRLQYRMTKAALEAMTLQLAQETNHPDFLVNTIAPGFIDSPLTRQNNTPDQINKITDTMKIKRLLNPIEIAQTVYDLGSDKNKSIHGQIIRVCGGYNG